MGDIEKVKCGHDGCHCLIDKNSGQFGKYCSEHCEQADDMDTTEIHCDCKHLACAAS